MDFLLFASYLQDERVLLTHAVKDVVDEPLPYFIRLEASHAIHGARLIGTKDMTLIYNVDSGRELAAD